MAEYIELEKTIDYLTTHLAYHDEDGFLVDDAEAKKIYRDLFEGIPKADVVERSKIDKAIKEVTNLVGYEDGIDIMNVGDDLMISWCKTLEIIKRNIRE